MKVSYRIATGFTLLTTLVVAALCVFIYLNTRQQQEEDLSRRLHNRALTVATLLFTLPDNDYRLLASLDSATTNSLVSENINVYNNRNRRIYRFARNTDDTVAVTADLLNRARLDGEFETRQDHKTILALYYQQQQVPVVVVVSAIDTAAETKLQELAHSLLLAFIAGAFLSFLAGWIFSKQLLKPLEQITKTVNNISATNIEKRLPEPSTADEWHRLAVTFNNLLARLQESFEVQGRFISNASHELSTPLTSVINQIDVTLRKERSNEEYLNVFRSVLSDVQNMSALTRQLLDIARSARGGSFQTEPVRIDEIIMELPGYLRRISPNYTARTFFDELPDEESLCTVNGNYELLFSAFRNLAENGCKYSPDHTVNISLSFAEGRIITLFSNQFENLDPRELENIFQPFQRGTNAGAQKGYGLGLSLTRRIILLHKGEIRAETDEAGSMLITLILPAISPYF